MATEKKKTKHKIQIHVNIWQLECGQWTMTVSAKFAQLAFCA